MGQAVARKFGHAEVDDLRDPLAADQDVFGGHVPVHDAKGCAAFIVGRIVGQYAPAEGPIVAPDGTF